MLARSNLSEMEMLPVFCIGWVIQNRGQNTGIMKHFQMHNPSEVLRRQVCFESKLLRVGAQDASILFQPTKHFCWCTPMTPKNEWTSVQDPVYYH